jgi:hypothetical protein
MNEMSARKQGGFAQAQMAAPAVSLFHFLVAKFLHPNKKMKLGSIIEQRSWMGY